MEITRFNERNVEDDILICLTVYKIPPYDYVKAFLKISKKKYEIIDYILWALIYHKKEGFDVKKSLNHILKVKSLMSKIQLEIQILLLK